MLVTPVFPTTLMIRPALTRKTPMGIINKPFRSFLETSIILSLRFLDFWPSDNISNQFTLW